ncbi:S41 family peptidase [Streptomyces sp. H27-D2]|uniref:S41 family peptidase n=1 Tax=Streptomyces sp. H27-D2 TaxID=3046304 RepID=UPI002DBDB381|nr:S41 family peptidase [Streptomyces sp. H27-D2]MEC4018666.1 S41 family peptidase [Streptomyces sp. H27-D2]
MTPAGGARRPTRSTLASESSVGTTHLRRLPALPERCTRPTPADPRTRFDVFWSTFEENYPFFAAKGIDWHAVRARYRPLVGPRTTDAELTRVLTDMIRPLHDAHTALVAGGKAVYSGLRPGTTRGHPRTARPGGRGAGPTLGRFTRPEPITVKPAHAPRYRGPAALLTSGTTISAGETFTQSLMARTPKVTRIGGNTQGVFSDVLFKLLPGDGWAVVLPNEEYLDRHGRTYDGPGIAPDASTPVFTDEELDRHQDSPLNRARQLLGGKGR